MLQSAIAAWIPCLCTSFMWELSLAEAAFSRVFCCAQLSQTQVSHQGAWFWGLPSVLAQRAEHHAVDSCPIFSPDFLKSSFLTSGGTSWWLHVISFLVFMNSKVKRLSFQSRFLTFLFPGQFFFLMDQKKPRIHSYLFFNLFFNGKIIVLQNFVFCQHQHESAIGIHMSPPISLPIPPLQVDTEPLFEFSETYSKFPLAIYFTYGNVSFHITLSIHLTFSSSLPMSISLFSMSVSSLLPCKFFSTVFLDSVYMH